LHPVLFHIGPVKVFTYGVMVMLGFLAAVGYAVRSARRYGISADTVYDVAFWGFLFGMVFARLVFVALNPSGYETWKDVYAIWQGGLSFHGGLAGGVLGGLLCSRMRKLPVARLMDIAAPAIAVAYGIGRIGCLLNGCCYGHACDLPWAMRFPDLIKAGALTPPSHPTQIYSALAGFLMFGLLVWLDRRPHTPGRTFAWFVSFYAVYRFIVEFFRVGATAQVTAGGLTQAQWASVVMFIGAVIAVILLRNGRHRGPE
jgi:phosphatidylglycerol:prolipoprotein diacylglycerol transferase